MCASVYNYNIYLFMCVCVCVSTGTPNPTAIYTPVGEVDQENVDGIVVVLILLGVLIILIGVYTLLVFLLLRKKGLFWLIAIFLIAV